MLFRSTSGAHREGVATEEDLASERERECAHALRQVCEKVKNLKKKILFEVKNLPETTRATRASKRNKKTEAEAEAEAVLEVLTKF